jgi:phosphoglycerate dehydrogenase-like enzyme
VVELTIGHLLVSARHIATADRTLRLGEWAKKELRGSELAGKRLGFIGFGRIAQGVAKVARALGMKIHAYDPYLPIEVAVEARCILHDEIDDVFQACTHVTVHCNYSQETHHLVNAERIAMMPGIGADGIDCGNHLVNCARGGIVDEDAASAALESGALSTLALDVYESEPLDPDHRLLATATFHGTPHIGASTTEAQHRVGMRIAEQLIDFFSGKTPRHAINPEVL